MKLGIQDYISIKLHQTDLLLTSLIKTKLAAYNLAPEQNLIMMALWEHDGLTQHQLVEKLKKDKTNIARMASNLEQKGFIKRVQNEYDKRVLHLHLTEAGEKLGEQVIPVAEQFNDHVCQGITQQELEEFSRILEKINANAQST